MNQHAHSLRVFQLRFMLKLAIRNQKNLLHIWNPIYSSIDRDALLMCVLCDQAYNYVHCLCAYYVTRLRTREHRWKRNGGKRLSQLKKRWVHNQCFASEKTLQFSTYFYNPARIVMSYTLCTSTSISLWHLISFMKPLALFYSQSLMLTKHCYSSDTVLFQRLTSLSVPALTTCMP